MADIDPLTSDFARKHPDTFARILAHGDQTEIVNVLERLPSSLASSIVSRLPSPLADAIVASDQESAERWLADAPYGDAVGLLGRVPRERSLAMVNSLADRERRRRLLRFLKYPAHSVGALVSDALVRLSADTPASDALKELRAVKADDPGPIVVLGSDGRYHGVLNLWSLIAHDPPVGRVRDYASSVPAIHPETSLSYAARDTNWNYYNWLPVVDHEQRVLGTVSRDRVLGSMTHAAAHLHRGNEMVTVLASEMLRVLGALLDRILGGRAAT